jgi:hypothetical protein
MEEKEDLALHAGDISQAKEIRSQLQEFQSSAAQRLKSCDETIASLSELISRAQKLLSRQPAWPLHEALVRFDLPLQRLTTQFLVTKKWIPRFFILRGRRLYYTNGKKGHADSREGALAFVRSNPAPDQHFCMDLKGAHARCVTARFVVHVCDTDAQAAVSRAATHPSMSKRSRWRSSSLQGIRCISMRALVIAHVTRHLAGANLRVPCCHR